MIPGTSLRTDGRTCLLVSEVEGVFVVEPMRFLFPFEAKQEAQSKAFNLFDRELRA